MGKRNSTRTAETATSREGATAATGARTTRTAGTATLNAGTIPTGARAEGTTATTAVLARVNLAFASCIERADFFSARFFCTIPP